MIYTHVARKGPAGVTSPLDLLAELKPEEVEAAVAATQQAHTMNGFPSGHVPARGGA